MYTQGEHHVQTGVVLPEPRNHWMRGERPGTTRSPVSLEGAQPRQQVTLGPLAPRTLRPYVSAPWTNVLQSFSKLQSQVIEERNSQCLSSVTNTGCGWGQWAALFVVLYYSCVRKHIQLLKKNFFSKSRIKNQLNKYLHLTKRLCSESSFVGTLRLESTFHTDMGF